MKKILLSAAFVAAFSVVSAQSISYLPFTENALMTGTVVSENGKYVGGCDTEGRAFIHSMETGKTKYFYSSKIGTEKEDVNAAVRYITNDGVGYGFLENVATSFDFATGEYAKNFDAASLFVYGTPDGKSQIGVTYDASYHQSPFCMLNGVKTELPALSEKEFGYESNGYCVTGMSSDASVILGGPVDNYSTYPLTVWRLNADGKTYTAEFLAADYYDGLADYSGNQPYEMFNGEAVSANGKWIAVNMKKKNDGNSGMELGRYNLETKTFEKISCPEGSSSVYYYAFSISNDGTIVGIIEDEQTYARYGMICKGGETEAKYLADAFPALKAVSEMDVNSADVSAMITPDGRYIAGYGYVDYNAESLCLATYLIDVKGDPTGISAAQTGAAQNRVVATYTLGGMKLAKDGGNHRGIVINRLADGRCVKVVK